VEIPSTRPQRPLDWPDSVMRLRAVFAPNDEVFLVGGAVRDALLHRPLHDIDLAVPGDGRPVARSIANRFRGAYYPLDPDRGVGRAIITLDDTPLVVDAAQYRGPDLVTDLWMRDFTVNAMAVNLTGDLQAVIDPTGGLADLEHHVLRRCTPDSISSDPARILRAIRASIALKLRIEPETRDDLHRFAERLSTISVERVRDEFFHILNTAQPHLALDMLQRLGLLVHIVPEAQSLMNVEQSPPHQADVWQHTLDTVEHLNNILSIIDKPTDDNLTANIQLGAIAFALSNLRDQLQGHLGKQWANGRTHRTLLLFAALMHDIGKPATRQIDDTGRIRFFDHERVGATLAYERAMALRLSHNEAVRIQQIVQNHMRPLGLSTGPTMPTRRAIYRFWRDTESAGIDICLLSLADYLATYGVMLDTHAWLRYVELIRTLLDTCFSQYAENAAQPSLLDGRQIIERFGLKPGPQIGNILEHLREAQAIGEISTTEEALNWVQRFLSNSHNEE